MNESRLTSRVVNFFALIRIALVIIVLAVLAIVFLGVPLLVSGHSMDPNFATGEVVLVQRFGFSVNNIQRGDVVVARFPADPSHTSLIKRVIGLPGDTVSAHDGQIYINGTLLDESAYGPVYGAPPYTEMTSVTLQPGEYFLAGDNRPVSSDSRLWGPVQASDIEGRVAFILWPFSKALYVGHVTY